MLATNSSTKLLYHIVFILWHPCHINDLHHVHKLFYFLLNQIKTHHSSHKTLQTAHLKVTTHYVSLPCSKHHTINYSIFHLISVSQLQRGKRWLQWQWKVFDVVYQYPPLTLNTFTAYLPKVALVNTHEHTHTHYIPDNHNIQHSN